MKNINIILRYRTFTDNTERRDIKKWELRDETLRHEILRVQTFSNEILRDAIKKQTKDET